MAHQDLDDPDLSLDMLMRLWPETIAVFIRHRIHTVIDACRAYDLEEVAFRAELHVATGT